MQIILELNTVIVELQSYIEAIEKNAVLYDEKNFEERIEIIDFMEFHAIDQIEELSQKTDQPAQLNLLKYHAEKIKADLEAIDSNLFQKLRANIRAKGCTGKEFKNLISEYVDFDLNDNKHQGEAGYDNLDLFINGLLAGKAMPEQTMDLAPEMVYYQKTPARIVFEMVERSHFIKGDIFFDLGSGLGQVAILVNLLTGITVKGIEFEPAFCEYAGDCAADLNLSNVTFINVDARKADYSEGTIFFMYTPFHGEMLKEVLDILREESLHRKIKIITYGPCTTYVALQGWLDFAAPQHDNNYKLGFFTSL